MRTGVHVFAQRAVSARTSCASMFRLTWHLEQWRRPSRANRGSQKCAQGRTVLQCKRPTSSRLDAIASASPQRQRAAEGGERSEILTFSQRQRHQQAATCFHAQAAHQHMSPLPSTLGVETLPRRARRDFFAHSINYMFAMPSHNNTGAQPSPSNARGL